MSSTSVAPKASPADGQRSPNPESTRLRPSRTPWRQLLAPVLLVVPMLASLLAVSLYPVLRTIWMAFRNTSLETQSDQFTGLANLRRLARDAMFWQAWRQTLEFTAVTTIVETLLGLVIALALVKTFRGRGLVRAAVLVPWAIPTVVTARMFSWLFDQGGLVNYLLVTLHLVSQPVNFLGSTTLALPTLMVADIWKTTPFMALLLLAGLQTIPPDLAEAARIDGASAWNYFRRVRLPLLMPTLLVASLLRALDAFRVFDLPYVVTGGGPASSTQTMSTYAYNVLFSGLELGYGSMIATAMFVTELVIAGVFGLFIVRRIRQEA
ncbi:MAG: sugar ABC transporter permease [Streptosporangiaceae bacterium]